MSRALFLDFDGALHPTVEGAADGARALHTTLLGWLLLLVAPVEPHPDVAIVMRPPTDVPAMHGRRGERRSTRTEVTN